MMVRVLRRSFDISVIIGPCHLIPLTPKVLMKLLPAIGHSEAIELVRFVIRPNRSTCRVPELRLWRVTRLWRCQPGAKLHCNALQRPEETGKRTRWISVEQRSSGGAAYLLRENLTRRFPWFRLLLVAESSVRLVVHPGAVSRASDPRSDARSLDPADLRLPSCGHRLPVHCSRWREYGPEKANPGHHIYADETCSFRPKSAGVRPTDCAPTSLGKYYHESSKFIQSFHRCWNHPFHLFDHKLGAVRKHNMHN